jgi:hypothetical protein
VTDDVFGGDVEHRLRRVSSRVRAAALDAQARDWVAERPDRVGFGRLHQAQYEITQAAGRYGSALPWDWLRLLAGTLTGLAVTLTILLTADHPASLPTLLVALGLGPVVTQCVMSVIGRVQRWRSQRTETGPAAIDDPYFHGDLTRRLEACAAAARADRSEKHRAAADDIGRALVWLSGARREQY